MFIAGAGAKVAALLLINPTLNAQAIHGLVVGAALATSPSSAKEIAKEILG